MPARKPLILTGLTALVAAQLHLQMAAAAPTSAGYVIEQRQEQIGRQTVVVSDKGITWRIAGTDFTIMMQKGQHRLLVLNQANKRYMATTFTRWARYYKSPSKFSYKGRIKKGTGSKIAGINATQYLVTIKTQSRFAHTLDHLLDGTDFQRSDLISAYQNNKAELQQVVEKGAKAVSKRTKGGAAKVYVADDIGIDPVFSKFLAQVMGLPADMGLVLRLVTHTGEVVLDTVKAEKTNVPASTFEIPVDFKKVNNEVALVISDENEEEGLFSQVSTATHGFSECVQPYKEIGRRGGK